MTEKSKYHIDKFVEQTHKDLDEFKKKYLEKHKGNSEHYPLELDENNSGLWLEFFNLYLTNNEV